MLEHINPIITYQAYDFYKNYEIKIVSPLLKIVYSGIFHMRRISYLLTEEYDQSEKSILLFFATYR